MRTRSSAPSRSNRTPIAAMLSSMFVSFQAISATLTVSNCLDSVTDKTSLRSVIANAPSGATIDFDALPACADSKITLTLGEIAITQPQLTIQGPTDSSLTIQGQYRRVFNHKPASPGTLTIVNLTIANGYYYNPEGSVNVGGCIASTDDVVLDHSTVTGCSVINFNGTSKVRGGAVYTRGNLTLLSSTVSNSFAYANNSSYGGGLYAKGSIALSLSTLLGNVAKTVASGNYWSRGGGFYAGSGFFGSFSSISSNQSQSQDRNLHSEGGGGFVATGNAALQFSTVDNNVAGGAGGGLTLHGSSSISDSTVSNNTASGASGLSTSGFVSVSNSTVAFNHSTTDTGYGLVFIAPSQIQISSSIVAENTAGTSNLAADLYVSPSSTLVPSGTHNLVIATNVVDASLGVITVNSDPKLSTLGFHGGLTRTLALLPGSPAIGAGLPGTLATDQRGPGYPRATSGLTDIGSFEFDSIFNDGLELLH